MRTTTPPRLSPRPAEAGFTLVEIMVVIVILGLLAALVVPNVVSTSDEAKERIALSNVESIANAVKMYRVQEGKLPSSLSALTEKNEKGRSYIEEIAKDPWGKEYELLPGDRPNEWEVVSWGPDGSEHTEDDISSRKKKDQ